MNRHLKPRTIKEWLELIPFDRAKREALENYKCEIEDEETSLSSALSGAFCWSDTKQEEGQGHKYWYDLYFTLRRMEKSIKLK